MQVRKHHIQVMHYLQLAYVTPLIQLTFVPIGKASASHSPPSEYERSVWPVLLIFALFSCDTRRLFSLKRGFCRYEQGENR